MGMNHCGEIDYVDKPKILFTIRIIDVIHLWIDPVKDKINNCHEDKQENIKPDSFVVGDVVKWVEHPFLN